MEVDPRNIFGCFQNEDIDKELLISYKNEELTIVFRNLNTFSEVISVIRVKMTQFSQKYSSGHCVGKSQLLYQQNVYKKVHTFSGKNENRLELGAYNVQYLLWTKFNSYFQMSIKYRNHIYPWITLPN